MMNSHIAIFLAGTENGGMPVVKPGACPSKVKSAWLTEPPIDALQFHPQQQKQINPKNIHEVPIARSRVQRAALEIEVVQLANYATQPAQSTYDVQRMGRGKHIEERTAGVGCQVDALGAQLPPRNVLSGNEKQSER